MSGSVVLFSRARRRRRLRVGVLVAVTVVVAVAGAAGVAALVGWPHVRATSGEALVTLSLPGFAGRVEGVEVRSADGRRVPVRLAGEAVWPRGRLASGERLIVDVSVRRPGWAGWLVGDTERRSFTIETPRARLLGRWLQVPAGAPVTVEFGGPIGLVSLDGAARRLPQPRAVVPIGVDARGAESVGSVEVAAAARSWERLPPPVRVSWFPARPEAQLLARPRPGGRLAPGGPLVLTFSKPVREVLGTRRPRLTPATPGRWRLLDTHTLAFHPRGLGFGLGATVRIDLPRPVVPAGNASATRTLAWQVPDGSTLRLEQLLAQLGYLPLDWQPSGGALPFSAAAQLAAAVSPPAGRFSWRYPHTPPELETLWQTGQPNQITRGAIMALEDTHQLAADGVAGPHVWNALLTDAIAGRHHGNGYSYVFVHRNLPQSLNLWHNGQVILESPGNTGVPAAPTQLGTFPVFEHIPTGTMSGTNPDGSHYHDPGIQWISYFNGGDAIHAFNRASFGTPQSLGCVELPLAAAAKAWPYTPIGTLVTIEN